MVDEIDTDLTRGSIGAARSVCDTLSENDVLTQEQRAALIHAEAILYSVGNQLDEQNEERWGNEDDNDNIIPIPEDAMSDDALYEVVKFVHGNAEDER